MPRLFGDGSYSIQHSLQAYVKFTTLRRCNKYTSNMSAVTVVDRMTSLSSHVYIYIEMKQVKDSLMKSMFSVTTNVRWSRAVWHMLFAV